MNQATVTLVFSPIRLNDATMPPPPILSSIPLAFTHMHVPKPHIYQMQSVQAKPLAAARSYRFTSHTHTGDSGSLVLHQCRLFTPSIHGADTGPQAMRLINFSEFQRAAPPLGLERTPLHSTLHQQEAATLQPADTHDYYSYAQKTILITKW